MSQNFVRVFLIIGLFKFAKDAPKFIKDAMGMKDSGGGLFDGMKSLGAAAGLAGGALMGGISGFAGGISATKARVDNAKQNGKRGIGAGIAGAFSTMGAGIAGLGRGGHQGFTGAGKNGNLLKGFAAATAAQGALNKKKLDAAKSGSTFFGRIGTNIDQAFTGANEYERQQHLLDEYKNVMDSASTFKDALAGSAVKSNSAYDLSHFGFTGAGGPVNLKQFNSELAAARAGSTSALTNLANYGFSDLAAAERGKEDLEKAYQKAYYADVNSQYISNNGNLRMLDGDAQAVISSKLVADSAVKGLEFTDNNGNKITIAEVNADNAGKVKGMAATESNVIKSSESYKTNKANAEAIKKSGK